MFRVTIVLWIVLLSRVKSQSARETCPDTNSILEHFDQRFQELDAKIEAGFDKVKSKLKKMEKNCEKEDKIKGSSCAELYQAGETSSGVYTIYPSGEDGIDVYCDMDTAGGGWTVFQRRQDGSVNFTRNWNDYRDGFGDLTGEFWLGNANLALITSTGSWVLHVDLGDWEDERRYAEYSGFQVLSEEDYFALNIGAYTGDAGDSLSNSNRMKFSTPDRDNDAVDSFDCAEWDGSGWWYNNCALARLNNPYLSNPTEWYKGIAWSSWHDQYYSLKFTEMKMRPEDD